MTKDPKQTWVKKCCKECDYFKQIIKANFIGECTQILSDHNGHILDCTHPACKRFDKGYPDEE